MESGDVLNLLKECGALLEGHFQLSSGKRSDRYVQCALVLQSPARAGLLGVALGEKFADDRVDIVVGPAMGGLIIGHEVARFLGAKSVFTERVDGRMTLRRGFSLEPGERVLVVEDVVTTGGSAREVVELVRALGAEVVGVGEHRRPLGRQRTPSTTGRSASPGRGRRQRLDARGGPAAPRAARSRVKPGSRAARQARSGRS